MVHQSFSITGKYVLDNFYDLRDVSSWGMFGTLLAWIALFRLLHYALFLWDVLPYVKNDVAMAEDNKPVQAVEDKPVDSTEA